MRAGLCAVGLASLGLLTADEADAKNKKKNKMKKRCKGDRPNKCGKGCCPSNYPSCCEWVVHADTSIAFTCAPATFTCCPVEDGGGACETGEECCPSTQDPDSAFGSCSAADEECCPSNATAITCPTGTVCSVNNACPVDYTIEGEGCCHPDAASRVGPARMSRRKPRFIGIKAR